MGVLISRWARRAGLFTLLVALFSGCFTHSRAHAGTSAASSATAYPDVAGWESPAHIAPVGTLCFETGGGRVLGPSILAAAAGWNKSDAVVVGKASCTGYARRNVVKFVAYYGPENASSTYYTCAVYDGGTWSWMYQRGVWVWVANSPTIRVNYNRYVVGTCLGSVFKKNALIAHETGHYLGLDHAVGITVMTSALSHTYQAPTVYDLRRVNGRY